MGAFSLRHTDKLGRALDHRAYMQTGFLKMLQKNHFCKYYIQKYERKKSRDHCLSHPIKVTVQMSSPCANIVKCCTWKRKTQFGNM